MLIFKNAVSFWTAWDLEFSPNKISLLAEAGKNYFIRQFIKIGVFVGGADLEVIPEETARPVISKLDLATNGSCEK